MIWHILFTFIFLRLYVTVNAQSYEDARCRCICTIINGTQIEKRLYTTNVPPDNVCDSVTPLEISQFNSNYTETCPQCQCKYESRNTTIIKVVVIIVIWIISLLLVYMLFLICLDPILNRKIRGSYIEHTNEEDESPSHHNEPSSGIGMTVRQSGMISPANSRNVLNRVGHQQDKWKKQVKEQRKIIYDRHTMLN